MATYQPGELHVVSDITIKDAVPGPIVVHPGAALVLMGTADGGVVVLGGGYARIAGTVGDLFVATGGTAVVSPSGVCSGSVTNDGGTLSIEGEVVGEVLSIAGSTMTAPGPGGA